MQNSFDNLNNKKRQNPIKQFFGFLGKHFIITAIIVLILTGLISMSYVGNKNKIIEEQKISEAQAFKDKMFSESHTKLQYFMIYKDEEDKDLGIEAAARLIAHTMETGCSTSYSILQEQFDQESLDFLQDYLKGKPCGEYKRPPVVCVEKGKNYQDFLVRMGTNDKRYIIEIKHNSEYTPTHFTISKYVEKNKIE